jgi:hypothetical protein
MGTYELADRVKFMCSSRTILAYRVASSHVDGIESRVLIVYVSTVDLELVWLLAALFYATSGPPQHVHQWEPHCRPHFGPHGPLLGPPKLVLLIFMNF